MKGRIDRNPRFVDVWLDDHTVRVHVIRQVHPSLLTVWGDILLVVLTPHSICRWWLRRLRDRIKVVALGVMPRVGWIFRILSLCVSRRPGEIVPNLVWLRQINLDLCRILFNFVEVKFRPNTAVDESVVFPRLFIASAFSVQLGLGLV